MTYFCIFFTFVLLFTEPPPPKLPQVVEADVTTTTITISLSPSDDTNGEIMWVLRNPYVRVAFVILLPAIIVSPSQGFQRKTEGDQSSLTDYKEGL